MGKVKEFSTILDAIVTYGEILIKGVEKLRELLEVISGLTECGKTLISSGKALKEYCTKTEVQESDKRLTVNTAYEDFK